MTWEAVAEEMVKNGTPVGVLGFCKIAFDLATIGGPANVERLETALEGWHVAKYGRSEIDVPKTMRKLGEEYGELVEAIMTGNPAAVAEEATDVLFVMMHIVRQFGGAGALSLAASEKLDEIQRRLKEVFVA